MLLTVPAQAHGRITGPVSDWQIRHKDLLAVELLHKDLTESWIDGALFFDKSEEVEETEPL